MKKMNTGNTDYLFRLIILLLVMEGCSKQDQIELIDHPPVVVPDTTLINYYGNLLLGNNFMPADTIFAQVQWDNPSDPLENTGYDLQALVGQFPSFFLHWEPHSANEPRILEGNYTACCALAMSDSARVQVMQWMLDGSNPATFPNLDPVIIFETYSANNVTVNISEVIEDYSIQVVGNDTFHIDQAKIKLSGLMQNEMNNSYKGISADFICYFARTN